MPKKPTTTREDMIKGAFELIRKQGHEALSVRNLARQLDCSTQPIMYQFRDLEKLKNEVYAFADKYHSDYILKEKNLLKIGLRYIRFAHEESNLFRFLFQSGHFDGFSLSELLKAPEAESLLETAAADLHLPKKEAIKEFEILFVLVHGYASLICNNAITYNERSIRNTLLKMVKERK